MVNQRGLAWLLLLSPFLLGLFFSWTAAIAVLFLLTLLLPYCREGKLRVSGSLLLPACTSVVIFLLLGVFRGRSWSPFHQQGHHLPND